MTPRKIKVKRLKLSEPMAGISIRQASPDSNVKDVLCRVYAKHGVNLTFISAQQNNQKAFFLLRNCGGTSYSKAIARQNHPAFRSAVPDYPISHLVECIPTSVGYSYWYSTAANFVER
jgi:hypothetical protein